MVSWLGMDPDEGGGWPLVDWVGEEIEEVAVDGTDGLDGTARTRV